MIDKIKVNNITKVFDSVIALNNVNIQFEKGRVPDLLNAIEIMHEGKKVKIKDDSLSAWKEVELEDGHIGWLPAAAIEKI